MTRAASVFLLLSLIVMTPATPVGLQADTSVQIAGLTQPVEIIRILLVFFLAGYFAPRWDVLRHSLERRHSLPTAFRALNIPPLEYTVPVFVCVALSLVFFFVQRDMGPALVFACLTGGLGQRSLQPGRFLDRPALFYMAQRDAERFGVEHQRGADGDSCGDRNAASYFHSKGR